MAKHNVAAAKKIAALRAAIEDARSSGEPRAFDPEAVKRRGRLAMASAPPRAGDGDKRVTTAS